MDEATTSTGAPEGSAASLRPVPSTSSDSFDGDTREESQDHQPQTEGKDASNGNVPRGTNEDNGELGEDGKPLSAQQKKGRYERTKQAKSRFQEAKEQAKAEQSAFQQAQAQFQAERAQFAKERADFEESKKPKRDYTKADLQKYKEAWREEGRYDLVTQAENEIAAMEAEEKASKTVLELPKPGTPEHKQQWEESERQLAEADPEFMRPGTRLDTKLREIFSGPNAQVYRGHPQGIFAAYDKAQLDITREDLQTSQDEVQQLKAEIQRLTGLTSIGGGVPGRMGTNGEVNNLKDFSKLPSAEMRKRLMADKRKSGSMSWL